MPHLNEEIHLDRWILSSYTFTDFPLPYLYTGRALSLHRSCFSVWTALCGYISYF